MKTARQRLDILTTYDDLGSYRAAAAVCGTTHKTVRRVVERRTGKTPEQVPAEVAPRLRQYLAWKAASRAEIVASEFQVFSTTYGYAGSCDALVRFADGSLWIVDYKTGKGIYAEHALQLMAYTMPTVVGADDMVDEALTELLHQVTGMAVLHLSDEGWEFHALEPRDRGRLPGPLGLRHLNRGPRLDGLVRAGQPGRERGRMIDPVRSRRGRSQPPAGQRLGALRSRPSSAAAASASTESPADVLTPLLADPGQVRTRLQRALLALAHRPSPAPAVASRSSSWAMRPGQAIGAARFVVMELGDFRDLHGEDGA